MFNIFGNTAKQLHFDEESSMEEKILGASNSVSRQLREKDGFSLLLLTVESVDNSGSRKFIICVDNTRARLILAKSRLTVLDYDFGDIVRGFGENEVVSEEAIRSAVTHFEKYTVLNAKMRMSFVM